MANKDWMFTDFEVDRKELWLKSEALNFVVLQKEKCPESGKEHLQGFLQLKKRTRLGGLKKLFGKKVHFEARRGSAKEAKAYCSKEESRLEGPWECGEMTSQGKRVGLELLMEMAAEGKSELEIAEADPATWGRNYRSINRFKRLKQGKRMWEMDNSCFWGEAGSGKTRKVYEDEPDVYAKPAGKWFDGYDGQEAVLIDDFTGDMDLSLFLQVLDRYPMIVETKGGTAQFLAKRIYVTSNLSPEEWYPKATGEQHRAIRRRFSVMKKFLIGI